MALISFASFLFLALPFPHVYATGPYKVNTEMSRVDPVVSLGNRGLLLSHCY